jgi:hypothetical protein
MRNAPHPISVDPFSPLRVAAVALVSIIMAAECSYAARLEHNVNGRALVLEDEVHGATVTISPPPPRAKIFFLPSPPRIVIDIPGEPSKRHRSYAIAEGTYVSQVRVGAHPDKTRVVLDLLAPQSYTRDRSAAALQVFIPGDSQKRASLAPQPASVEPSVRPDQNGDVSTVGRSTAAPLPPMAGPILPPGAAGVVLRSLTFSMERVPALRLKFTEKPRFTLARHGQKEYVLTVPGAALGSPGLSLPHFPPQRFEGLTHVLPADRGDSTELRIGVEAGFRLTAVPEGDEIVLRTISPE